MLKFFAIFFFLIHVINAQRLEDTIVTISDYIASEHFSNLRSEEGDPTAIDTIFQKALRYNQDDISETLLSLTFSLLADYNLPLKIPLLDIYFKIPLPSAEDSLFKAKVKNLPGNIFFDSSGKDKDKLAHFFGSAFLAYHLGCINAPEYLGIFIEYFEAAFKVHGALDRKDIVINYLGGYFGRSIRENKDLLPSQVLNLYALLFLFL